MKLYLTRCCVHSCRHGVKKKIASCFFFPSRFISVTQTELCLNIGAHTRTTRWVVRGSKTIRRNRTTIVCREEKKKKKKSQKSVKISSRSAETVKRPTNLPASRHARQNDSTIAVVVRVRMRRSVYTRDYFERPCPNFNASTAAVEQQVASLVIHCKRRTRQFVHVVTLCVRYRVVIIRASSFGFFTVDTVFVKLFGSFFFVGLPPSRNDAFDCSDFAAKFSVG